MPVFKQQYILQYKFIQIAYLCYRKKELTEPSMISSSGL
jgi:hypothetical protein